MFKKLLPTSNGISIVKENYTNSYPDILNKKYIKLLRWKIHFTHKYPYLRNLLLNETASLSSIPENNEISDYEKNINLTILLSIIIGCILFLIGIILLIIYLCKKCKKNKEEEEENESEEKSGTKKSKKDRMSYEMSNFYSSGKNFTRSSTKKNFSRSSGKLRKTKSLFLNSSNPKSSRKMNFSKNKEVKRNSIIGEQKIELPEKKENEYSNYTFSSIDSNDKHKELEYHIELTE